MTKREFYRKHEHEAFEIAMRQNPGKNTAYWAGEADMIIEEWWRDYESERV